MNPGTRSFIQAYRPEVLLVVYRAEQAEQVAGSTRVRFVRVADLAGFFETFPGR